MFYNIHVCNVVMSLILLLNIVNIVVKSQEPTFYVTTIKTMFDNVFKIFMCARLGAVEAGDLHYF